MLHFLASHFQRFCDFVKTIKQAFFVLQRLDSFFEKLGKVQMIQKFENFVVEAVVGGGIDGFAKIGGVALHFVENDVFADWTLDIRKGL